MLWMASLVGGITSARLVATCVREAVDNRSMHSTLPTVHANDRAEHESFAHCRVTRGMVTAYPFGSEKASQT